MSHAKTSRQDDSPTPQDKAQHVDGQPAVKAIHANRLMLWADRHYQYDELVTAQGEIVMFGISSLKDLIREKAQCYMIWIIFSL